MAEAVDQIHETVNALRARMRKTASGESVTFDALHVREVLVAYWPLRPDVAYMPVPRCDACEYWHGVAEGSNETSDGRKTCVEPTISPEQNDELMTLPGFGCVQWTERGA